MQTKNVYIHEKALWKTEVSSCLAQEREGESDDFVFRQSFQAIPIIKTVLCNEHLFVSYTWKSRLWYEIAYDL